MKPNSYNKQAHRKIAFFALVIFILLFFCAFLLLHVKNNRPITIYLIRHGQTESNINGILVGGDGDSPLTKAGKESVAKTGHALQNLKFARSFSSPLGRARSTGEIILKENQNTSPNLKTISISDLRDIRCGDVEGMSVENATRQYGDMTFDFMYGSIDQPDYSSPIHAENMYHFYQRFDKAMSQVINSSKPGENVLVTTHSSAGFWLAKKLNNTSYVSIDNASVTILQYQHGKWSVLDFNDTDTQNIRHVITSIH